MIIPTLRGTPFSELEPDDPIEDDPRTLLVWGQHQTPVALDAFKGLDGNNRTFIEWTDSDGKALYFYQTDDCFTHWAFVLLEKP